MNNKISFGIIGCSAVAAKSTIPAILKTNCAELKMIGSRSLSKAREFAEKFSCNAYGDYDEVLERSDIDAVYISLPISLHEKWVIKSARAGKHIICEKSSTTSHNSAKKMLNECKRNDVRILESFSFRFHPQHNAFIKIIQKNELGKLFRFSSSYGFNLPYSKENIRFQKKLGGGALNDVGCYPICSSRIIFQDKPHSVTCNLVQDKKNGVDVKGSIYMTYDDMRIAFLAFGFTTFFQSNYSVWGNKGIMHMDRAFNVRENMSTVINVQTENKIKKLNIKPVNQFQLMIMDFCKELQNSKSTTFGYEDDLLIQAQVMEAARQSHKKKRTIYVNEV